MLFDVIGTRPVGPVQHFRRVWSAPRSLELLMSA